MEWIILQNFEGVEWWQQFDMYAVDKSVKFIHAQIESCEILKLNLIKHYQPYMVEYNNYGMLMAHICRAAH